ncbi:hypothetical protein [uncultured Sneathiella sp.]|uniref:hypothetical protein n=1 Tax=uncultured Sneathiella sp. TaxID=879315 RepID=UPI002594BAE3|nr:hypothetical protein [uncultured Sneathiella sp.]
MKKALAIFVVLTLGLSACAQSPATVKTDAAPQKTAVSSQPAKPAVTQSPTPKETPKPPVVAAIKPRAQIEPTVVVGKTAVEIQGAFGDPNLRRIDSPAEVWQYLAQECAMHLFFYPGPSGKGLVVRHIAINGRSVDTFSDLDRKQCFNDHLKAVGAEEAFIARKAS